MLFGQLDGNLLAQGLGNQLAFHLDLVDLVVLGNHDAAGVGQGLDNLGMGLGLVDHGDHVADGELMARGQDALAVNHEMAVGHVLAGGIDGAGEAHAEDRRVGAGLELGQQHRAGRLVGVGGLGVVIAHLLLGHVVDGLEALLLEELQLIGGGALLAREAVLAGREGAADKPPIRAR